MTWRFMLAMMSITAVVLLVLLIPISGYLAQTEHDRITTALERDAFVLAGRAQPSLAAPSAAGSAAITDIAKGYRDASVGARVVVVDAAGIAIVTSDDDTVAVGSSFESRPEIATALKGQIANGSRYSQTLSQELVYVAVPVLSGEQVLGAVRLTYPAQVVTDASNSKVSALGIVALTTVLLAGIIGWIMSLTVTRPLRQLTRLTERFADGDLEERADERAGAPELRSLSRSFNAMAEHLTAALDQQRRFAADASHQLRTPLTALRLRLERARELAESDAAGPGSVRPHAAGTESADRLGAAVAEADRLETIIEGLLQLSRGEGSMAAISTVDVAAIARTRVEQWLPLGEERGTLIVYRGPDAALARASDAAVEQIVDNYLDNALSVSSADSTIEVRVDRDARQTTVHVLDHGPGLPEADLSRAFDRFWRGRSDDSGSGLGLSIVAQLARASGGTVRLENRAGGGLDAQLSFESERGVPRGGVTGRP